MPYISFTKRALSLLSVALLTCTGLWQPATAQSGPNLANYDLVFEDDFLGSSLDATKWDTSLLWGPYLPINNEEQMYVDTLGMHDEVAHTPFEISNSTLKITATATTASLQPPPRPAPESDKWSPNYYSEYAYNGPTEDGPGYQSEDVNYLSGIITSYGSFKMTHGYVETRAKLPKGTGLWPAFWLLNTHYVEDSPEIDVMEFLGDEEDVIYHTYHYFEPQNDWRKISTESFKTFDTTDGDWTNEFHTFGMAWSPKEITWYVDDVEVRKIDNSQYDISKQAMYLIANLAVGGNWPGAPDPTETGVFPATFEIDYIRAYKRKQSEELDLAADFQLMFNDEFIGTSLDATKWTTHFLWGPYLNINSEEQYYVDALGTDSDKGYTPFFVGNGALQITAQASALSPTTVPPPTLPVLNDPIWSQNPEFQRDQSYQPAPYTSGMITSYDSFKFVNGYAEIRAIIPSGDGLWPAFWLLNSYYVGSLPEIDIMEVRGEDPTNIIHTYHRSDTSGVPSSTQFQSTIANPDEFHTYGVRWRPGKIVWYVDGQPVATLEEPLVAYQLMYVIANLAVGGDFNFADTDPDALPAKFIIDYIRVYQDKDTAQQSTPQDPDIISPLAGTTLLTNEVDISFTASQPASQFYWVHAGSSQGSNNYFSSGLIRPEDGTDLTVTGIPQNGDDVHVTLHWYKDSAWQSTYYTYLTEAASPPTITQPLASDSPDGSSFNVTWSNNGMSVDYYWLYVGSTQNTNDIYNSGLLNSSTVSQVVDAYHNRSSSIWIKLFWYKDGLWNSSSRELTSVISSPSLILPVDEQQLLGTTTTFEWASSGVKIDYYWLRIGSTAGSSDFFNSGLIRHPETSQVVSGFPNDGSTFHARLYWYNEGAWSFSDTQYSTESQ